MQLGIIGIGNMGAILAQQLSKFEPQPFETIHIYDIFQDKAKKLAQELSVSCLQSPQEIADKSDVILLSVKPNVMGEVLTQIRDHLNAEKIVISIAAGVPLAFFEKLLGENRKIFRTMPNTPALIGEGITAICWNEGVQAEDIELVQKIFTAIGRVESFPEKHFDVITALTGSSPAYYFMFIEAMADAAVSSGLPRESAYRLAQYGMQGSAGLMIASDKHPAELKDMVCSPGGTTIEAVKVLEKNNFRYAIFEAVEACAKKANQMEEGFK